MLFANAYAQRTVAITGPVKALAKIFEGTVDTSLAFSGGSSTDLRIIGDSGAIAMRLARVRIGGDLEFK